MRKPSVKHSYGQQDEDGGTALREFREMGWNSFWVMVTGVLNFMIMLQ
jgi:hypothetical protein